MPTDYLTDEEHRLILSVLEDFQRILANAKLAYKDLQGDGYEAMEYLRNIQVWATSGEEELERLALSLSPQLAIPLDARIPSPHGKNWEDTEGDIEHVQ